MRTTSSTSTIRARTRYRHREAGAFEVVVASDQRLALMREFEQPTKLDVHELIAELDDGVDWVLVEGFKHSDLPRSRSGAPHGGEPGALSEDEFIVAIATDAPDEPAVADRAADV